MHKHKMPVHHLKTLSAIARCRTAELGGHIDQCDACGHLRISYNSCRNRHCPKCQGLNKEMWIIQQEDMLLPVTYYHVVFTLPHELNLLCMYNPRVVYDLLFNSAWYTINTLAKDPQWIGANTAATMLLHTWSQNLSLHPHLHCIVPNGGLTNDGQWQFPKKGVDNFLFPVVAITRLFKGYFMHQLKQKIKNHQLDIPKNYFAAFGGQRQWHNMLYQKSWNVFTKKPFSNSKHVIDYLGRYSHRVAITNQRILAIDDRTVKFEYKDYRTKGEKKIMSLTGQEFLRRFCLHILPPRYRKVRYYGFIANACKTKNIKIARAALSVKNHTLLTKSERKELALIRLFGSKDLNQCPCCKTGSMQMIITINKNRPPPKHILSKIKTQNSKKRK